MGILKKRMLPTKMLNALRRSLTSAHQFLVCKVMQKFYTLLWDHEVKITPVQHQSALYCLYTVILSNKDKNVIHLVKVVFLTFSLCVYILANDIMKCPAALATSFIDDNHLDYWHWRKYLNVRIMRDLRLEGTSFFQWFLNGIMEIYPWQTSERLEQCVYDVWCFWVLIWLNYDSEQKWCQVTGEKEHKLHPYCTG